MLKFVTTKPPRGRSPSGSGTPDRDVIHRMSRETSPSATSLRTHYSPRIVRKHHSFSHPHQYPDGRASSSAPSYRTSPNPSRGGAWGQGQTVRRPGDQARTYQAPPEFRSSGLSEQDFCRQQSYLLQPQERPLQQQQQLRQQLQPGSFAGTKYAYQQAAASDSGSPYATLYFRDSSSDVISPTSKENKFPLELEGLYSTTKSS
ncbi:unnamed protein product, partial [Lymnaea stagnalis]